MTEYTEDCCFNEIRDCCKGAGCPCGCHEKQARMTRQEWQTLKVQDFERLEAALEEVADDYRIMLSGTVAKVGTDWRAPEDDEIRVLCERIGYGAVIARAAYLWQCKDPVGAFVQGPCLGTVQSTLKKIRTALKKT